MSNSSKRPLEVSEDSTATKALKSESAPPPSQKPKLEADVDDDGVSKNYYLHKDATSKWRLSAEDLSKLANVSEVFDICPQVRDWWRSTVVYEVYVRSFMDSNGDGIGDLKGIQSKLEYFVDLGVETLWISPFYTSPMKDFGYDISNFKDVDPIFGTLDDFNDLMKDMKQKGLKLIMDFVPNHTSDQHDWFKKSCQNIKPYSDYYVWKAATGFGEDGTPIPPNNWVSVFGGPMWEWNEHRREFYLHQFTKEQPDLDFNNPAVVEEIKNVLRFWLDRGVDGFRMDAVAHIFEDEQFRDEPPVSDPGNLTPVEYGYWNHCYTQNKPQVLELLRKFRVVLDEYSTKDGHPRLMMTEAYLEVKELAKYYGDPEEPIAHFPFNFDLISNLARGFQPIELYTIIKAWLGLLSKDQWPNWVLGNHDVPRVTTRFGPKVAQLMTMISMLLPGTNVVYYGEEIGMEDMELTWDQTVDPAGRNAGEQKYRNYSRDPERTPMQWNGEPNAGFTCGNPWLPVNKNFDKINVASLKKCGRNCLETFKQLTSARKLEWFLSGKLEMRLLNAGTVLAFSRMSPEGNEGLLVLANFVDSLAKVNASVFHGISKTMQVFTTTSTDRTERTADCASVELGPFEGLVLKF